LWVSISTGFRQTLQKFFSPKVIAPSHLCLSVVMAVMVGEMPDVLGEEPTRTY
jgi:hypothetical protein